MKPLSRTLASQEVTVFTTMSALAERHGAINLGQGFPDTEGPAAIVEAARAFLGDGRNQYAPLAGLPELRRAVAAASERFWGIAVDPDREVVVTAGGTEAIFASLAALVEPGDEVVLLEPLYDTYLPALAMLGAVPRIVRLAAPDWSLPRAALAAAFGPRTKAILLNDPMNPTGKVFSRDELEWIAALLVEHDAYAVCDEVYEHLVFPPARHLPLMALPGMRERCVRIGSAGKTFSLTGWKIGYAVACPAIARVIANAHGNVVFAAPPNLQRAVAVGLALDDGYFAALAQSLAARRRLLADGLGPLGFSVLPADATYFLTAGIAALARPGEDDVAFCRRMVETMGVAAIPVSAFYAGDAPRDLVRFAFCKRPEILEQAIDRLARGLAADRGGAPAGRLATHPALA